jgi:hypothetical protein
MLAKSSYLMGIHQYGHPSATMDAILATIVANRQA